ncbi:DoxX-like family protein [Jannaschia sp.]|nr:DoxX-like family protein [Jannaschia sp.]
MTSRGYGAGFAAASVAIGAAIDIALGAAILWRPWARAACLGMATVATLYLVGGTVLTPGLWADPLGPLTKILPAILLPLMTRAVLEDR